MVKSIIKTDVKQILTSGSMGFGNKDHRELFKPSSLYELGTHGQIKSHKQNSVILRENVKVAKQNIDKSTARLLWKAT